MQDVICYLKVKTRFETKKQLDIKIIKICQNSIKLTNLLNALNRAVLCQLKRSQKRYRRTKKLVVTFQFDCPKFINILIVFIRKKCKTIDDKSITVENEQYKRKIHLN